MEQQPTYQELLKINQHLRDENKRLKSMAEGLSKLSFHDSFLEIIPQMVSYTNKELVYEYVNKAYEKNFNISKSDIIGKSIQKVIGDQVLKKALPHINKVLEGNEVYYDEKFEYPGKRDKYIQGHLIPDKGKNGGIEGYWAVLEDISERKKAQEELYQAEALYRNVLNSISDAVYITDENGNITFACENLDVIFGYDPDDIKKLKSITELFGKSLINYDELQQKGEIPNLEHIISDKQGIEHHLMVNIKEVDIRGGKMLYTCRDVTERKKMEEELLATKSNLSAIVENYDGSIWSVDKNFNLLIGNQVFHQAIQKWLGKPIKRGQSVFLESTEDTMRSEWENHYRRCLKGERFSIETETKHIKPAQYMEYRFNPIVAKDGKVEGITVFGRDITKRRQVEIKLKESEFQKNIILNATNEMIAFYTPNLQVIWTNRAAAESIGKTTGEMAGLICYNAWHQRDKPCEDCPVLKSKTTGRPQSGEQRTPDGRYWQIRSYPVYDDDKNLIALVEFGQDISEKKEQEIKIIEAEKSKRKVASEAAYLGRKLDFIRQLENELKLIIQNNNYDLSKFTPLMQLYKSEIELDKHWELFKDNFESLHSGFFKKLLALSEDLTQQDIKHCAFIKMNFETKEIATLFNIKPSSVQMSRVRLKKKLGVGTEVDLRKFILSL